MFKIATLTQLKKNFTTPWNFKDVLIVSFISLLCCVSFFVFLLFLFDYNKTTLRIARYFGSLLIAFFPIFWLKKKYGLAKEVLGLRKGELKLSLLVLIGAGTAIVYSFLLRLTPLWRDSVLSGIRGSDNLVYLILAPLSIDGFATLVLTPISEEIMDRGFIYGYLRGKYNIYIALILQALLFSLLHIGYFSIDAIYLIGMRFMPGLILGILYETTGSLYTSIVCHAGINYLAIALSMSWK